jgi:putative flippase GtrA
MSISPLRRRLGQLVRYGTVSAIATTTSLVILTGLVATAVVRPAPANVVATLAGMVPSFELNRRWVWGGRGRPSLRRQILPFAVLSLSGLVLSTAAVAVVGRYALAASWSAATTALAAALANVAAFGTVWVVQFFVLDRLLFGPPAVVATVAAVTAPETRGAQHRR